MKVGAGPRGSLNKNGQNLKNQERFDGASKGIRASGGGAENRFAGHIMAMKQWLDAELANGVVVEPEEVVLHFEWMLERDHEELVKLQYPTDVQVARKHEVHGRLQHLKNLQYRKNQKELLMKSLKYVYLKPQRQTDLTVEEEATRCQRTWRQFDAAMHRCLDTNLKSLGERQYWIRRASWSR